MPQLASCLKGDFVQFLPAIMQSLINDAKKDIDFKVVDVAEAELEEQDEDEKSPDI